MLGKEIKVRERKDNETETETHKEPRYIEKRRRKEELEVKDDE